MGWVVGPETWGVPASVVLHGGAGGLGSAGWLLPGQALSRTHWEVWGLHQPRLPEAPRPGAVSAEPSRGLGPWRLPVSGAHNWTGSWGGRHHPRGLFCRLAWHGAHSLSGDPCPPCPRGPRRPARSSRCRTRWLHVGCGSGPSRPRLGPRSWLRSGNRRGVSRGTEKQGRGWGGDSCCRARSAETHPVFERPPIRK